MSKFRCCRKQERLAVSLDDLYIPMVSALLRHHTISNYLSHQPKPSERFNVFLITGNTCYNLGYQAGESSHRITCWLAEETVSSRREIYFKNKKLSLSLMTPDANLGLNLKIRCHQQDDSLPFGFIRGIPVIPAMECDGYNQTEIQTIFRLQDCLWVKPVQTVGFFYFFLLKYYI